MENSNIPIQMCLRNFEIYLTSDIGIVGGNGNVFNWCLGGAQFEFCLG